MWTVMGQYAHTVNTVTLHYFHFLFNKSKAEEASIHH